MKRSPAPSHSSVSRTRSSAALRFVALLSCVTVICLASAAHAQRPSFGGFWSPGESSNDGAQRQLIPVRQAYRAIESRFGGQPIDLIGVYPQAGSTVYVVSWLSSDGRRLEVTVDAHSGAILSSRGG